MEINPSRRFIFKASGKKRTADLAKLAFDDSNPAHKISKEQVSPGMELIIDLILKGLLGPGALNSIGFEGRFKPGLFYNINLQVFQKDRREIEIGRNGRISAKAQEQTLDLDLSDLLPENLSLLDTIQAQDTSSFSEIYGKRRTNIPLELLALYARTPGLILRGDDGLVNPFLKDKGYKREESPTLALFRREDFYFSSDSRFYKNFRRIPLQIGDNSEIVEMSRGRGYSLHLEPSFLYVGFEGENTSSPIPVGYSKTTVKVKGQLTRINEQIESGTEPIQERVGA
jgi:hypothetical protein